MASRTPAQHPLPIRLTALPRPGPVTSYSLPAPVTSFVGRDREVSALTNMLQTGVRLVTLTGPGGVGKTRLAVAVAGIVAPRFADGVLFIPLAPLRDGASITPALAQALGVDERLDRPAVDDVKEALRARQVLLVLDNFEHLTPAAPVIAELLEACPRAAILVTSRVRLRISGEYDVTVPLPPLPEADRRLSIAELRQNPAVRLFEERAAATQSGFVVTERNAEAIAAICRRLEGLPLAIELAAARSNVLTPTALLSRLDRGLPVLAGGPVDAPERLRTMRDAIAWSYDLLSPEEQALFRRLSVFVGGFTLDAAEAVCGGGQTNRRTDGNGDSSLSASVLDSLTALIEASLVQRIETADGDARFRMLETVREYALERLAAAGETDETQAQLAAWCRAVASAAETMIQGTDQARWFGVFETEHDNFRAAIGWAIERGDGEEALRLINGPLWFFWSMRGWLRGERHWLERALALAEHDPARAEPSVVAKSHFSDGLFFLQTGDYPRARARFETSLTLYRALGDQCRSNVAVILSNLATMDNDQGDYDRSRLRLEEALGIRRRLGVPRLTALTLVNLGNVATLQGDHETAIRLLDEALPVLQQVGDQRTMAYCLMNLGEAEAGLEHHTRAMAFFEETLGLLRQTGDLIGEGVALVNLASSAVRLGDGQRAAAALAEALVGQRDLRNPLVVADALEATAEVAVAVGRSADAPRFLAVATAIRDVAHTRATPSARRRGERVAGKARSHLGRRTFDAGTVAGRALTMDDALAAAIEWLSDFPSGALPLTGPDPTAEPVTAPHGSAIVLTERQRQVLRLLVAGNSDPEIADTLGISTRTVESHVAGLLNKLGLHARTAAVAYAVRHRLV